MFMLFLINGKTYIKWLCIFARVHYVNLQEDTQIIYKIINLHYVILQVYFCIFCSLHYVILQDIL
jgi:hypothetical protein